MTRLVRFLTVAALIRQPESYDPCPNRLLVIYVGRQRLVPTACTAYLDDARQDLLGRYILASDQFNTGLTGEDF